MGKDLVDVASDDSYLDPSNDMPSRLELMSRASKDLEAEQMDYDSLLEGNNPSPSLRDQEYLQHSSLWGHQFVSGGGGEGPRHITPQIKTDATLPAYCNPPNPVSIEMLFLDCRLNLNSEYKFAVSRRIYRRSGMSDGL